MNTYTITVAESGVHFACREDETLLAAMLRARCGPVHHGCCGGGCGVCKMRVAAGPFARVKNMSRAHISEAEAQNGAVLLCCITPLGNMTVGKA